MSVFVFCNVQSYYFLLTKFGAWVRWGEIDPTLGSLLGALGAQPGGYGQADNCFVNDLDGLSNFKGSNFTGKMG